MSISKILIGLCLLGCSAGVAAVELSAATSGIEVHAIYQEGDRRLYSLYDKATNQRSWLEVGGVFEGYTLVAFDSDKNILRLNKGDEAIEIALSALQRPILTSADVLPHDKAVLALHAYIEELVVRPEWLKSMRIMNQAEAERLIPDILKSSENETGSASFLTDADQNRLAKAQRVGRGSDALHVVPIQKSILPIEISCNLTDADMEEANKIYLEKFEKVAAQFNEQLKKLGL